MSSGQTPKTDAASPLAPPRPKYQVFVSSTFQDLREEREAVTWEILKAGHIPVGMENFSASDERGWEVIESTIDLSDYYVLILAGRYGSIDKNTKMSWTEREYRYAVGKGLRVLPFLRDVQHIIAPNADAGPNKKRLTAFIADVRNSHHCESWTTRDDLRAKVVAALLKAINWDEQRGTDKPGWYRGNRLPATIATEELARLSSENRDLRLQNSDLRTKLAAVAGAPTLEVDFLDQAGDVLRELIVSRPRFEDTREAIGGFSEDEISVSEAKGDVVHFLAREQRNVSSLKEKPAHLLMTEHNRALDEFIKDPVHAAAVQSYVRFRTLPRCTKFAVVIRNAAGPTTRDVRCELKFPPGFELYTELPKPELPEGIPQRPRLDHDVNDVLYGVNNLMGLRSVAAKFASISISEPVKIPPYAEAEGETAKFAMRKLQHGGKCLFAGDDIITVLPPPDTHDAPMVVSYCVWSDEAPPREGHIPLRVIQEE